GQEVPMANIRLRDEAAQGHLGQYDGLLPAHTRLLEELVQGPMEQVEVEFGRGPETAPFHQDWLFVEDLRGLHDLPARREHGGVGQPRSTSCRLMSRLSTPGKAGPENFIMSSSTRSRDSSSMSEAIRSGGSLRRKKAP